MQHAAETTAGGQVKGCTILQSADNTKLEGHGLTVLYVLVIYQEPLKARSPHHVPCCAPARFRRWPLVDAVLAVAVELLAS